MAWRLRWSESLYQKRAIVLAFALLLATISATLPARADYEQAKQQFENLNAEDRASITLGLIATGDFVGLLNFGFTKRFYNSVTGFQIREGFVPDGMLKAKEMERLNQRANQFYAALGIKGYTHPSAGSKLLVPRLVFDSEVRTEHGLSFERADSNLSLSFFAYPASEKSFSELYVSLSQPTAQRAITYSRLKTGYFVASGTFNGRYFYTWVSEIPGGTTGFTLSWTSAWGEAGAKLSILLANSFAPTSTTTEPELPRAEPEQQFSPGTAQQEQPPESGTGTGFILTTEGHVLTNFHVAGHCQTIRLRRPGEPPIQAELVADDESNDLAMVKAKSYLGGTIARFVNGPSPRAGSEIVVYGFPLGGLLSAGGNIVTGNITALTGLGNDSRIFQISAPVQPGNSGGPVLDRNGSVVAVVVSKLDVRYAEKLTGDIPQNVNFAIKANVAMNFLDGAGITYAKADPKEPLDTPTIADMARRFTLQVECQN